MAKTIQTMAANLAHAAFTKTSAKIGGGDFGPVECSEAAKALDAFPAMLAALRKATAFFASDPNLASDGWMSETDREVRAAIAQATSEAEG